MDAAATADVTSDMTVTTGAHITYPAAPTDVTTKMNELRELAAYWEEEYMRSSKYWEKRDNKWMNKVMNLNKTNADLRKNLVAHKKTIMQLEKAINDHRVWMW